MKEFMTAAFPLLLLGLSLAVIAVEFVKAKEQENEKKFDQGLVIGAGLGIVFGQILNVCGFLESNAICFTMGPMLGMAIASLTTGWIKRNEES
ncbi:MAG: hypothetical protein J6K58_13775 [Lachnospiraceae bacterium]|nr:hypothetical protein [Lachnospiraceae bacterium]